MFPLLLAALLPSPIPLEPGTWWEYRESYTEHLGEVDSTTDDLTHIEVRGSRQRPFLDQRGGADPSPGPVEVGEGWIRLGPWTGEDSLPVPLEPGRAGPPSAAGTAGFVVEVEEEVTVPAGTFTALRCALRTRRNVSILWIVPEVGVVRETQGVPGQRPEIERVLLRWGKVPAATAPESAAPRPGARRPGT